MDVVYQVDVKLIALRNVEMSVLRSKLTNFIDSALLLDDEWKQFHQQQGPKGYSYDSLRMQDSSLVHQDIIYVFTIRTVHMQLAEYLQNVLRTHRTDEFQGLATNVRMIPKKIIDTLYTQTPAVLYRENGYWVGQMSIADYLTEVSKKLVLAYNKTHTDKIDENHQFATSIVFQNQKPIASRYKDIYFLGDKFVLSVKPDAISQKLAYFALGAGILEKTSRGYGFLCYRWL